MGRDIDQELKVKILEFIKSRYMINNQEPVGLSFAEIAEAVGINPNHREKVLRYITALRNGGAIKTEQGKGSSPNKYTYVKDDFEIPKEYVEMATELYDRASAFNDLIQKIINSEMAKIKRINELTGELAYYTDALSKLKFVGDTEEGVSVFEAEKNSNIKQIIDNLRGEK